MPLKDHEKTKNFIKRLHKISPQDWETMEHFRLTIANKWQISLHLEKTGNSITRSLKN